MIRLGKHEITSHVIQDDHTVIFRVDSNRAKVYQVSTREFQSIVALSDVKHAINTLDWISKSSYVFAEEHETVMAHINDWKARLTEDVNKTTLKLELD